MRLIGQRGVRDPIGGDVLQLSLGYMVFLLLCTGGSYQVLSRRSSDGVSRVKITERI